MNTQFWVIQAFNGISYGALLFLVGSGLSLIFGVMRIVNLSHGAYFLWGGYIALSVICGDRLLGAVAAGGGARGRAHRPCRWSACFCARKASNICATPSSRWRSPCLSRWRSAAGITRSSAATFSS